MAEENRDWGYDRIVGALANLGYEISDQTVGNILPLRTPRASARSWAKYAGGWLLP
jgi:putative transposase